MQQRYADSGQTLLIELQNYEQQGISIWLEGFPSSSVEVSEVMCVREDTNYMRDYVFRQGAPDIFFFHPTSNTLAMIPATVATNAPARVQRVFFTFTIIK